MDEPKLGFFSRFYYSIADFNKYRFFLRQGTGKAVAYLILISLVVGIISFIPFVNSYNKVVDELITNFDSKVPDFKLSDGKLQVSGKMPIIIGEGSSTIIIDTSPNADETILNNYDTAVFIGSDKMIQKNYVDRRVTQFSTLKGFEITRENVKQALPVMKVLVIFIFIFGGIFFICAKFISALIISLAGLAVNSIRGTNLSFRSIFKLSVYAMTLPLLLCTVLDLIPAHIPYVWLIFYVIAAVYLYGAINSIKKQIDSYNDDNNLQE